MFLIQHSPAEPHPLQGPGHLLAIRQPLAGQGVDRQRQHLLFGRIRCRLSSPSSRSKYTRRMRLVKAGPRAAAKASSSAASLEQPQFRASQISSLAQLSEVHRGGKLSRC